MPLAPLRPCATPGCNLFVRKGQCPACTSRREQFRGSASSRGYGVAWRAFRVRYIERLVAEGIAPICGATLPEGPQTADSQCKASGLVQGDGLHLDHDPPLQAAERLNMRAVCDPLRVQVLCGRCHSFKTMTEANRGGTWLNTAPRVGETPSTEGK